MDLVSHSDEAGESLLRMFWDHQDAVLCCSFKVIVFSVLVYQSGLFLCRDVIEVLICWIRPKGVVWLPVEAS